MVAVVTWAPLAKGDTSGLVLTPERQIPTEGGAVFHAIKKGSTGFNGFGEAYFSLVEGDSQRDWKCHTRMTLNLVVPVGRIAFLLAKRDGDSWNSHHYVVLGPENYARLTVPPHWFMTFAGLGSGTSLLMNIADLPHNPDEAERLESGAGPRVPALELLMAGEAVRS